MNTCKHCGKEMLYSFGRRLFCSDECSKAYSNRKCKICGKTLTGNQRKYCSNECKRKGKSKYEYDYHKDQYKKPKAETKPQKKKKPALSIAEINKLARAEGLNYGQFVGKYGL